MKTIYFITGNKWKVQIAKKSLKGSGIRIVQKELDLPEIQNEDVEEVAKFSAKWAAEKLQKPVVVTDAGYYIKALKGFPGPFIKFINKWLTTKDLLRLMGNENDRAIEVRVCLAYCEPGKNPVTFTPRIFAKLAKKEGRASKDGYDTTINRLMVHAGFNCVESEIPKSQIIKFWSEKEDYWKGLASYLGNKRR